MNKTWIKNGTFITMDESRPVIEGHLVMDGSKISYIGTEAPAQTEGMEVVDGRNKLYMPGLVNTHGHAAMSLLRGYADDLNLQVWLQEKIWPMEGKIDAPKARAGVMLSIVEMIKSGTTTFVDMYDNMDETAKAVEETGVRARLCRGVIGLCPPDVQTAKLEEAVRFAKDWHGKAEGRITTMMAPHAPYTCPPDYIERIVQAAHDLQLPIHTHMSETAREVQDNVDQYGARPVAHLEKLGVFTRPTLVAHGVHLTDEEIEILARHDVRVSHNPGSNLKLASGVARLIELTKAGVLVSLGTDGAASNNNLDMFEEVRLAALIHKGVSGDPTAIPAAQALRMGTLDGARSIWLEDTGALKEGYAADIISLKLDQPHLAPKTDLISHVVYSAAGQDTCDMWVNGRQLLKNRVCLTVDEEKVMAEAARAYGELLA
ncbi:amidohydrolase [Paenibacillus turpanensis]|uniref:amidohydrolase n=1 Tax=Paenibacillus turpanensis TaxID=2689078 RepID=UPI00140BFF6F|nr:amidohydrolase [Paenibacillus turpanensis]